MVSPEFEIEYGVPGIRGIRIAELFIIFRLVGAGAVASLAFIKKPAYHWVVLIGLFIAVIETTSAVLFKLKFERI